MTKYEEHLQLKQQIDALESRQRELEVEMIEEITTNGKPTRLPWGTYSKVERKTYSFSDEYEELLKEVKAKVKDFEKQESVYLEVVKNKEIVDGTATEHISTTVRFVADKDKMYEMQFGGKQ